jgi:hypothetical protein
LPSAVFKRAFEATNTTSPVQHANQYVSPDAPGLQGFQPAPQHPHGKNTQTGKQVLIPVLLANAGFIFAYKSKTGYGSPLHPPCRLKPPTIFCIIKKNQSYMKINKPFLLVTVFALLVTLSASNCNKKNNKNEAGVTPVPLATGIVPGFKFPEDASVINGWINDKKFANGYDSVNIYKHAWGVWAGLTASSGQTYAGDKLLVYETWLGLNEVRDKVLDKDTLGGCQPTVRKYGRAMLTRPKQFEHAARFSRQNAAKFAANITRNPKAKPLIETAVNQWVTVSYSPDAACFATKNQIFRSSVINSYYKNGGLGQIPPFPNTSLTIKPTYLIFQNNSALFKMPVWLTAPNPADSLFFAFANNYVYIDRNNQQPAGKKAVPVDSIEKNPAKIAAATINLSDFINFTVDQQMADFMNTQDSIQGLSGTGKAVKGQVAVLVGMHVTTKEISNWTWQSYYWTPNRDQPGAPSSNLAASLRPTQITGAAANYACVASYVMLTPNNAANTTAGAGPMFGYNPYLEGGFGPTTFGFTNTYNSNYQYGSQSNCMSCHALALPSPAGNYTTDQNINLQDTLYFKNQVSLDFAWSIQTAFIKDEKPYWER